MPNSPVYSLAVTEAICEVIAQTDYPGLRGSEIAASPKHERVFELEDGPNKRTKLLHTLHNTQVRRRDGATPVVFLRAAMDPTRYVNDHGRFNELRDQLNEVLVLHGLAVNRAASQTEAAGSPSRPKAPRMHEQLLMYCREELIARSLFHALSEAAKSIPDRVRCLTGISLDGAELYDEAFGTKNKGHLLAINPWATPSEESEHKGFKSLLVGVHGHHRNPRAHATRLGSQEDRRDLLDAFSLFSYIHRRLDHATIA